MKKRCIACGSSHTTFLFAANKTTYYECSDCTHIFTLKVPNSAYESYDHLQKYLKWKDYLHNVFERRISDIAKYKARGKVLEVGCSVGFMLDVLKKRGYDAQGLEPSKDGVEFCKKKGFRVYHGYLGEKRLSAAPYDVVILNHVFEHIKDLPKACSDISKLLKKDGIVFIECPNFSSFEAKLTGKHWRFLQPHEHFSQFNPISMRNLLEKNGFEILLLQTNSPLFDFYDLKAELWRCLKYDKKRFIYYFTELPMATVEALFHRGKGIEVIARRKIVTSKI
jgi:SAM-dependent methyltransferase